MDVLSFIVQSKIVIILLQGFTEKKNNMSVQIWRLRGLLNRDLENLSSCYPLDQYTIHILTFITDNLLNFLVSLLTFNPSGGSSSYNSLCRGLVYMENWVLELQKPLNWCKDGVKISRFLDPQEVELEMERFRLMTCEGWKYSYKKQTYLKQHPLNP